MNYEYLTHSRKQDYLIYRLKSMAEGFGRRGYQLKQKTPIQSGMNALKEFTALAVKLRRNHGQNKMEPVELHKEKVQFYYLSQGSLTELKNHILVAKGVGYLNEKSQEVLLEQANMAHQLLQGLIKKSKTFLNRNS